MTHSLFVRADTVWLLIERFNAPEAWPCDNLATCACRIDVVAYIVGIQVWLNIYTVMFNKAMRDCRA